MIAEIEYARSRYFSQRQGWGPRGFRPMWLEAIVYGVVRAWRLRSRGFNKWCDEVDALFVEQYDWPRSYTLDSGRDCYIDEWVQGATPQDAVDCEVDHWDY